MVRKVEEIDTVCNALDDEACQRILLTGSGCVTRRCNERMSRIFVKGLSISCVSGSLSNSAVGERERPEPARDSLGNTVATSSCIITLALDNDNLMSATARSDLYFAVK